MIKRLRGRDLTVPIGDRPPIQRAPAAAAYTSHPGPQTWSGWARRSPSPHRRALPRPGTVHPAITAVGVSPISPRVLAVPGDTISLHAVPLKCRTARYPHGIHIARPSQRPKDCERGRRAHPQLLHPSSNRQFVRGQMSLGRSPNREEPLPSARHFAPRRPVERHEQPLADRPEMYGALPRPPQSHAGPTSHAHTCPSNRGSFAHPDA